MYGVPVPKGLEDAIEEQRDNLSKADSLLGCLVVAMEYQDESADTPYYPDVARMARELVKQSMGALDPLVLQQRLLRDKIKDEGGCNGMARPVLLMQRERLVHRRQVEWIFSGREELADRSSRLDHSGGLTRLAYKARVVRLHRRNYGRVLSGPLSSNGASAVCASAKIWG
jgi:hypothetical protein